MKVSLFSRASLFLAAFGILGASIVSAQNFVGGVRGTVQDPAGAVIGDAKVTLSNDATGTARSTQSNALGEYTFAQVEPATYSISVEAPSVREVVRPSNAHIQMRRRFVESS